MKKTIKVESASRGRLFAVQASVGEIAPAARNLALDTDPSRSESPALGEQAVFVEIAPPVVGPSLGIDDKITPARRLFPARKINLMCRSVMPQDTRIRVRVGV